MTPGIGSLLVANLILMCSPVFDASSMVEQCSNLEDETCLFQTHHQVKRASGAPTVIHHAASHPKVPRQGSKWYQILASAWDFESDAGGLTANVKHTKEVPVGLKAGESHPKYPPHPLWKPEWHRMLEGSALMAGFCLWIAGVLCCAGGIGGGGIYVTVLMVFGALSVHDAIPLSKVVVFAASTPSLILNLMKTINLQDDATKKKSLIDWNLCRIVVPWALIGTLCGVFLNSVIPSIVIVAMLSTILFIITAMTCRTGWQQRNQEIAAEEVAHGGSGETPPEEQHGTEAVSKSDQKESSQERPVQLRNDDANVISKFEILVAISMLLTIIYCGTVHVHAERCAADVSIDQAFCYHPIAMIITFYQMPQMKQGGYVAELGNVFLFVAIGYCTIIGSRTCYTLAVRRQVYGSLHRFDSIGENYASGFLLFYVLMSMTTGCLAGLVGIGGGLIFSPVFIQMALDPHVAVATSATCVIFTSSSTTFQYLFADRIIVALIISFCVPHLFAAYTGTKIVHHIQDHYGAKKSWITWIVAAGVGISCILAVGKLFDEESRGH